MAQSLKKIFILFLFFMFAMPFSIIASYSFKTIGIDIGHGGKDSGAHVCNKRYKEKDICLQVGLKLKEQILKQIPGVKVVLTRDKDMFIDIYERAKIMNRSRADLVISLHCNSCRQPSAKGMEVYVMAEKGYWKCIKGLADLKKANERTMERNTAYMENRVIFMEKNYKKKYFNNLCSPDSKIVTNIASNANLQSSTLFSQILASYSTKSKIGACKVLYGNLVLLWKVIAPSVLVELGFMTNKEDLRFMTSKNGQKKLVQILINSIKDFKKVQEYKNNMKQNNPTA